MANTLQALAAAATVSEFDELFEVASQEIADEFYEENPDAEDFDSDSAVKAWLQSKDLGDLRIHLAQQDFDASEAA